MNWLHFVGKQYYSISNFEIEAQRYGVSRRIAPKMFKKMNFGDKIFLAQGDKKGSKIFGYFVFNRLLGVSSENIFQLINDGVIELKANFEPTSVIRGCGSYNVSACYAVKDPKKLLDHLKSLDNEELKGILIGGEYHNLDEVGIPKEFVNTNIPFQMGFRGFDFDAFKEAYKKVATMKRIRIKGMFYAKDENETDYDNDSNLFQITDYKQKGK